MRVRAEGLRVLVRPDPSVLDEEAIRQVATGRGMLGFVLGGAESRLRLFGPGLRWERVILARIEGRSVGFAAFRHDGLGPYAPGLRAFCAEFGMVPGLWRWAAFRWFERRDADADLYLYGLKVEPAWRRMGIAEALVEAMLDEARRMGARHVGLEVATHNLAARRLYRKAGFRLLRVQRLGPLARLFRTRRVLVLRRTLVDAPQAGA